MRKQNGYHYGIIFNLIIGPDIICAKKAGVVEFSHSPSGAAAVKLLAIVKYDLSVGPPMCCCPRGHSQLDATVFIQ